MSKFFMALLFIGLYIITIVALNLGFSYVPMIDTMFGMLSPMAVIAGAVFVMRDFAQRYSGHFVLIGMAAGAGLSFWLADPFVAMASLLAFGSAEIVDYLIYSLTKKPFHERVLYSSLISAPIDTAVFLLWIQGLTPGTFVLMVLAKLVAALIIWYHGKRNPTDHSDDDALWEYDIH